MNFSKKYDDLIKQSIGNKHMLLDYPYYDDCYFAELRKEIEERNLLAAFGQLEFRKMSNGGIKICAVASSSRIGFLHGIQSEITGFEKKDVKNGICRPHYDNFDDITKTFYEYKCHEFTSDSLQHNRFANNPEGYKKLLSKHFIIEEANIDCQDLFQTFGIAPCLFFDFKQFLCHVLGILSVANREEPANFQYVMFIPRKSVLEDPANSEIADWLGRLKTQIIDIFEEMSKKHVVACNGESGTLKDFIRLRFEYQDVSEIVDFIYEKLKC